MARKTIFNFEALGKDYAKMLNEIRAGNSCSIFGIQNSMRPAICESINKKILFVTADNVFFVHINVPLLSLLAKFIFCKL